MRMRNADKRSDKGNILRHYEQEQFELTKGEGYVITNSNRPESPRKTT